MEEVAKAHVILLMLPQTSFFKSIQFSLYPKGGREKKKKTYAERLR